MVTTLTSRSCSPFLVAKERDAGMVYSTVVPRKGSTGEFAARRITAFIKEIGCEFVSVIMKSDQEPAIQALLEDVRRMRADARTLVEMSPVGESASNGVVERGIQSVQGQVRTMKSVLETRWGQRLGVDHPALTWIVEHAAVIFE